MESMTSDQQYDEEQVVTDAQHVSFQSDPVARNRLHPVTIFQVLHAEASGTSFEGNSLVIDGIGFAAVIIVAHVTRVDLDAAKVVYFLEDGTGKIVAEKDFSSVQHGLSAEIEAEERAECKALESTYVEVTGVPHKRYQFLPRIKIKTILPIDGYHQVMYHMLNVIHSDRLIRRKFPSQPPTSGSPMDIASDEQMEVDPVDNGPVVQAYAHPSHWQDDLELDTDEYHIVPWHTDPDAHAILPNTFSPQKRQPYAALEPLERAIMMYMCHNRTHCHAFKMTEMARTIQALYGCSESQFDLATEVLLSEAYITSPLDDGYVILTPRQ